MSGAEPEGREEDGEGEAMKDLETGRLGDGEQPYFRQFMDDMQAAGGIVFKTTGLVMGRDGKMIQIPRQDTPQEVGKPQRKAVQRRVMTVDEAAALANEKARCGKGVACG